MYLVIGCFHWIGFHLTKTLLEDGCRVLGIDTVESEKQENLYMFFGRNSLFDYREQVEDITKQDKKEIEAAFLIDDDIYDVEDLSIKPFFKIQFHHQDQKSDKIQINIPLLYGEWMPRNKEGVYNKRELITFDSKKFKQEAVHIEDFINALRQLLNSSKIEKRIDFSSFKNKERSIRSDCYLVCIRETETLKNRLEYLNKHYEKFNYLY